MTHLLALGTPPPFSPSFSYRPSRGTAASMCECECVCVCREGPVFVAALGELVICCWVLFSMLLSADFDRLNQLKETAHGRRMMPLACSRTSHIQHLRTQALILPTYLTLHGCIRTPTSRSRPEAALYASVLGASDPIASKLQRRILSLERSLQYIANDVFEGQEPALWTVTAYVL